MAHLFSILLIFSDFYEHLKSLSFEVSATALCELYKKYNLEIFMIVFHVLWKMHYFNLFFDLVCFNQI